MTDEGKIKLVRGKNKLLSEFEQLNGLMQEYGRFLHAKGNGGDWHQNAVKLLRSQQLMIHQARTSLGTVDLVCALLRQVLSALTVERFSFKGLPDITERDVYTEETQPELEGAAEGIDFEQLISWINAASRNAPLELQGKLQHLLGNILDFFRQMTSENAKGVEEAISNINLLTTNRQTQNLVREIATITRDIYNALQNVSEGLPLDSLSETSGGISEAVKRLKSVIVRLDEAAEENIANMEEVNTMAQGEEQSLSRVIDLLQSAQMNLMNIKAEHPDLADALTLVQNRLSDEVGGNVMELKLRRDDYTNSHMELISNQGFHELTGNTLKKIIAFIETLESELFALLKESSPLLEMQFKSGQVQSRTAPVEEAPAEPRAAGGEKKTQDEVDKLLGELGF